MKKKYSIIFIGIAMITLNVICLNWAIQQRRMKELAATTASDRKQILSLLLGNIQMHYTYSECQLPDIILIDKLKNEITLSSIIADKRKLALKFSPQNCYSCIEFAMFCLEELIPFVFVMNERLCMDDLFIPIKEMPNYSDLYFHIIKQNISGIYKKRRAIFLFVVLRLCLALKF